MPRTIKKNKRTLLYTSLFFILLVATSFKLFKPVNQVDVDTFSKQVLETLKTKNFEGYKKLLMTNSEFTDMVMSSQGDEESKVQTIEMYEEGLNEDKLLEFNALIDRLTAAGVDFSKIEFKKAEFDEYSEYGVDVINCAITFSAGEFELSLTLINCFKTKNGWRMSRPPMLETPPEKDDTCNDFSKEIIGILARKDVSAYKAKIMTDAEVIELVKKMNLGEEMEKTVLQQLETVGPQKKATEWYDGFQADLDAANFVLSDVVNKAEYTYTKKTEKGVGVTTCTVNFPVNDKNYIISIMGVKTAGGWKIVDRMQFDYEGKYNYDYGMTDTTAYDPYTDSIMNMEYQKALEEMQAQMEHMADSIKHAMEADSARAAQLELEQNKGKKKKKKNK